jgi:hypothetical protein
VYFILSAGAFFGPSAYTIDMVEATYGSSLDGDCPSSCTGIEMDIETCNCPIHSGLPSNATSGVLFDGVIPTLNTSSNTWAAPLLTIATNMSTAEMLFQFESRVLLREIELYLFHCPSWEIGAESIAVYNSETFPSFVRTKSSNVGRVTLESSQENCESLTQVSIPLVNALSTIAYVIEFSNPDPLTRVYLAEARFSDDVISILGGCQPSTG